MPRSRLNFQGLVNKWVNVNREHVVYQDDDAPPGVPGAPPGVAAAMGAPPLLPPPLYIAKETEGKPHTSTLRPKPPKSPRVGKKGSLYGKSRRRSFKHGAGGGHGDEEFDDAGTVATERTSSTHASDPKRARTKSPGGRPRAGSVGSSVVHLEISPGVHLDVDCANPCPRSLGGVGPSAGPFLEAPPALVALAPPPGAGSGISAAMYPPPSLVAIDHGARGIGDAGSEPPALPPPLGRLPPGVHFDRRRGAPVHLPIGYRRPSSAPPPPAPLSSDPPPAPFLPPVLHIDHGAHRAPPAPGWPPGTPPPLLPPAHQLPPGVHIDRRGGGGGGGGGSGGGGGRVVDLTEGTLSSEEEEGAADVIARMKSALVIKEEDEGAKREGEVQDGERTRQDGGQVKRSGGSVRGRQTEVIELSSDDDNHADDDASTAFRESADADAELEVAKVLVMQMRTGRR